MLAAAADLSRVCAFLHPDDIPEELITKETQALGTQLASRGAESSCVQSAIRELLSYTLVKRNTEDYLLSIHRLVQAVLKDCVNVSTYRHWAERVVQAVNNTLPSEVESGTSTHVSFEQITDNAETSHTRQ